MKTNDTTNTTPPDPYAPGLAAIRAARATPQSRFAEQYATELRAAATTAPITAPATPRLTAAEMAAATPPDPYAPGLAALAQRRTAR